MSAPDRQDEQIAEELLEILREDEPGIPANLHGKTLTKVRAAVTMRDLVDLTTLVFVLRFCAPIIDLIAAMFGVEPSRDDSNASNDRRDRDE